MVVHIWPRVRGSSPVVGSSRKISGGRVIRLAARSSRRRMPPENCEIGLVGRLLEPELLEQVARRSRGPCARCRPWSRPKSIRFSVAVRFSSTEAYWPVTPRSWRTTCGLRAYVGAEDRGVALVDREQGREHLEHGGLAGTVGSEDAEDLAAADGRGRRRRRRAGSPNVLTRPCASTARWPSGGGDVVCRHVQKPAAARFHRSFTPSLTSASPCTGLCTGLTEVVHPRRGATHIASPDLDDGGDAFAYGL